MDFTESPSVFAWVALAVVIFLVYKYTTSRDDYPVAPGAAHVVYDDNGVAIAVPNVGPPPAPGGGAAAPAASPPQVIVVNQAPRSYWSDWWWWGGPRHTTVNHYHSSSWGSSLSSSPSSSSSSSSDDKKKKKDKGVPADMGVFIAIAVIALLAFLWKFIPETAIPWWRETGWPAVRRGWHAFTAWCGRTWASTRACASRTRTRCLLYMRDVSTGVANSANDALADEQKEEEGEHAE